MKQNLLVCKKSVLLIFIFLCRKLNQRQSLIHEILRCGFCEQRRLTYNGPVWVVWPFADV